MTIGKTTSEPSPEPPHPTAGLRTVDQAAEWLGVSSRTVRRLITRGELPTVRIGKLVRVRAQDLEWYVRQQWRR